jgi:hypothetical protein
LAIPGDRRHERVAQSVGRFLREQVPASTFPVKPSRAASSFAFETLADATFFRDGFRPGACILRVRFVDPMAARHRVTWSAFPMGTGALALRHAHEVWSGRMLYSGDVEVFAQSDLVPVNASSRRAG